MSKIVIALFVMLSVQAMADTPPPGAVKIKGGSDGTLIGNSSDSLKVTGTTSISGNVPVTQVTSPWVIFGNTGRTWTLLNSTDSVNVGNFPSTFGVTQSTSPWVISGSVDRTWNLSNMTDSVNVGNFPSTQAVTQSTSPWVVSGTVTANQGSSNVSPWNENISQYGGSSTSLGQKSSSASIPAVIASDQSTLPVNSSGKSAVTFVRNSYSSNNVTTSAYFQLISSTPSAVSEIEIFDSSGQTLKLAFGGSGSEVDQVLITPGGNGRIPLKIPASTRVSIKSVSATANSGEIDVNCYQ